MSQYISQIPELIDIPTFTDDRGTLSVIEAEKELGFSFKRIYYLYNINENAQRGAHAHKNLKQCMIAMAGEFKASIYKDGELYEFHLKSPGQALIIPPGCWRDLKEFSKDAVCLVGASEPYEEDDYIHDYEEFKK
ncbi:MAG: FdtA/QdtA family cupin domain-containing protein [Pseudomonadota bacterium]